MLSRRASALHVQRALIALICVGCWVSPALAQRPTRLMPPLPDEVARPDPRQTRPLPEIVAQVQSRAPYNHMDYIGVAGFDIHNMVYVLRFLDGRQVIAVRVDGRSGRIVGPAASR